MYWQEARWPWWSAVLLVAVDLGGLAVTHFVLGWTIWGTRPQESQSYVLEAILGNWSIFARLSLVLAFACLCLTRGVPAQSFGVGVGQLRERVPTFLKCIAVLSVVCLVLFVAGVLYFKATGNIELLGPPVLVTGADWLNWVAIFVVALPPLEELLYRGVAHATLRRYMGPTYAIIAGGLLFGLLHRMYGISFPFVWFYAIAGVMLAWVYERTGSLLCPWILHAVFNLAASLAGQFPGFWEWLRGEPL